MDPIEWLCLHRGCLRTEIKSADAAAAAVSRIYVCLSDKHKCSNARPRQRHESSISMCVVVVLCLHCTEFVLLYVLCCDSWRLLFPFLSHTANPGGERDHVKGERDYMNDGRWIWTNFCSDSLIIKHKFNFKSNLNFTRIYHFTLQLGREWLKVMCKF